jgi:hypothetical protein
MSKLVDHHRKQQRNNKGENSKKFHYLPNVRSCVEVCTIPLTP